MAVVAYSIRSMAVLLLAVVLLSSIMNACILLQSASKPIDIYCHVFWELQPRCLLRDLRALSYIDHIVIWSNDYR